MNRICFGMDLGILCCRVVALAMISLSAATVAAQPQELRIVEKIWGFDGRVMLGQFNPVSVLVDNLSDQPIEGQVTFRSISGMIHASGGALTEPLYLAPNTRRWVQFYPYINRHSGSWRLTVQTGEKRTVHAESLDQPRTIYDLNADEKLNSRHAAVILDKASMPNRLPTSVKHMPDEIFPPYATATSALRVLFLDHVPDWETPRQTALLSWLRCGGRLHLLSDSNGRALQFSGTLAPLNEPFGSFAVGSGTVVRHNLQRGELSDEFVRPLVTRAKPDETTDLRSQINAAQYQSGNVTLDPSSIDGEVLADMRSLTQPEHAWWLILLLSLAYIGLIFPGCWILSQKKTIHFLATYGAITLLAIVFSVFFLIIGRRGYGESTVMHALAVARLDDNVHWNTLQWNSLFVTTGANYSIGSDNQQALLASGNSDDKVDADIRCGNTARFDVRIPPFSSQSLVVRRRVSTPDWELNIKAAEVTPSTLVRLELSVGTSFPADKDCQYLLLFGDTLYQADLSQSGRILTSGRALRKLPDFCNYERYQDFQGGFGPFFGQVSGPADNRTPAERFYEESLPVLTARSLLDDGVRQSTDFVLPADRVRLLVHAPMSDAFQMSVSTAVRFEGRVLYVRDLLLQSSD